MLLRRFIGQRLAAYYAQSPDAVVGGLATPVRLSSLWGEWHWKRVYQRLYYENKGQWLTPVELFQPYYSQTVANYLIECMDGFQHGPVDILELGGGRGTHARHVMDHLHHLRPDLYERVIYTILDASPSLHSFQQTVLSSSKHAKKFRFTCRDLLTLAECTVGPGQQGDSLLLRRSERLTLVMGLEILDNLPHDKIRLRGKNVDQAIVRQTAQRDFEEVFVPLDDDLIQRVLNLYPAVSHRRTWIPTVICGLVEHLSRVRPNLHWLLADFDWLPGPSTDEMPLSTEAYGEPLVTNMDDVDMACYLAGQAQLCDILFPTDFERLADFVKHSSQCKNHGGIASVIPQVWKQTDFLQAYGPEQVAATKSWLTGFSPLLGDFGNCSVLTTHKRL